MAQANRLSDAPGADAAWTALRHDHAFSVQFLRPVAVRAADTLSGALVRADQNFYHGGMREFRGIEPDIVWGGAFEDAELDAIIALGNGLTLGSAALKGEDGAETLGNVRSARIGFLDRTAENKWLYDKMAAIINQLNKQTYRFALSALERFQYTVYDQTSRDHYDWHMDQGATAKPRKLSLVLQLSSPSDYEGCDLQIQPSAQIETMTRARGALICFPSYILHRVTPITAGTRRSLVIWCSGPRFQ
jgi:PKHD-type hydroxylase